MVCRIRCTTMPTQLFEARISGVKERKRQRSTSRLAVSISVFCTNESPHCYSLTASQHARYILHGSRINHGRLIAARRGLSSKSSLPLLESSKLPSLTSRNSGTSCRDSVDLSIFEVVSSTSFRPSYRFRILSLIEHLNARKIKELLDALWVSGLEHLSPDRIIA